MIEKRRERFTEAAVEDEIVVMRTDSGEFFSIAGTGRDIWPLIDGSRDRAAILSELEAEFEAPRGVIAAQLDAFLAQLADAGLITRA